MHSRWRSAVPVVILVAGVACSLVVYAISLQFELDRAAGAAPSLSMVAMINVLPFLITSTICMLIGAVLLVRRRNRRPSWLTAAVTIAVLLWQVAALAAWPVSWIITGM